jgi:NADH-quinone oxidoreductase subunit B
MAIDEGQRTYDHPLYRQIERMPGVSVALGNIDELLTWGSANSLWIFPMATSCCGIEFMAASASGVDLDRMGSIPRGTPRQCDVMVVAGTITVKMAPRVKKLWEQMPEPKWCVAMGSCAISGDFYRDIYSVVPGIDTFIPVDVYVPGCPPNPEALMHGLLRLQEKIRMVREGTFTREELRPESQPNLNRPAIGRLQDASRDPLTDQEQSDSAAGLGLGDSLNLAQIRQPRPEAATRSAGEPADELDPESGAEEAR